MRNPTFDETQGSGFSQYWLCAGQYRGSECLGADVRLLQSDDRDRQLFVPAGLPPAGQQDLPGEAATARPPPGIPRGPCRKPATALGRVPNPSKTPETWGFDFLSKHYYISWHAGEKYELPPD